MTGFPALIVLDVGRKMNWRLVLIITVACLVAQVMLLPYALTLQSEALANIDFPLPLPLVITLQVAANSVIIGILATLGLFLATRIGLGLPFLEGWLDGNPKWGRLPRVALVAALLGLLGGGIIVALDVGVFNAPMQQLMESFGVVIPDSVNPNALEGFLASFYGGIAEEVQLRLVVMTFFAWLGRFIGKTAENRPTPAVLWIANILAAVLFGLGHLPTMQTLGIPITELVIIRAVILNGVVGVAAGWLYARYGLESAMICHFSADIVLHVITPLVAGTP